MNAQEDYPVQEPVSGEINGDATHRGLDQRVDLASVPFEWLAWGIVFLAAIAIRLVGRTNWPLSAEESAIARDAWSLALGDDLSTSADRHPFIVQLTSLLIFLFGDSDFIVRLTPLLASIGVLGALFWLRSWFGSLPAISIAIVWTISPVMTMSALRLDGGTVLMLSSLLVFALILTLSVESGSGKAIVLGVAIAVGLTSHPLAWLVIPFTIVISMFLMREYRFGGHLFPALGSALVILLLTTSWCATQPAGVVRFFSASFSALWRDHIVGLGADWQMPLLVLLMDEPVILLLGVIGLGAALMRSDWNVSVHPAVFIACIAWSIPMLTVGSLVASKGPAVYAASLFPLIIVAGLGLSMLLDAVAHVGWNGGHSALWAIVSVALFVAIVRFADVLARGPGDDSVEWLLNAGAVGLLIILPLGYAAIRLVSGTGWSLASITLLVIVVLFGTLGMRTSILLPSTVIDRPGELLHAGSSAPSVGRIEHRLRTYSRDITASTQDVRDPAGGHGLMIVVDENLADPFVWYFRDFPNLIEANQPGDIPGGLSPDAVLVHTRDRAKWETFLEQHQHREYPFRFAEPDAVDSAVYRGLLLSATNPLEYRNLFNFVIYRNVPQLLVREEMVLFLQDDHAAAFWGSDPEQIPE